GQGRGAHDAYDSKLGDGFLIQRGVLLDVEENLDSGWILSPRPHCFNRPDSDASVQHGCTGLKPASVLQISAIVRSIATVLCVQQVDHGKREYREGAEDKGADFCFCGHS